MTSVTKNFRPIPTNIMKMKNLSAILILAIAVSAIGCGKLKKSSKGLPSDGQLHGVAPGSKYNLTKPPGMVYIPPGTFHMGPSDEDINYRIYRKEQTGIH